MPQHVRRERPDMDADHLRMVADIGICVACGIVWKEGAAFIIDPHHLMHPDHGPNSRGMGRKSADKHVIPLCRGFACPSCHDEIGKYTRDEDAWLAARGIDGRAVSAALWGARGYPDLMRRIVERARAWARIKREI